MCDCTPTTMCVPCQAAEAWDSEPPEIYVDPYCMHCGRHEENHDMEYCHMVQDEATYAP